MANEHGRITSGCCVCRVVSGLHRNRSDTNGTGYRRANGSSYRALAYLLPRQRRRLQLRRRQRFKLLLSRCRHLRALESRQPRQRRNPHVRRRLHRLAFRPPRLRFKPWTISRSLRALAFWQIGCVQLAVIASRSNHWFRANLIPITSSLAHAISPMSPTRMLFSSWDWVSRSRGWTT